MPGLRRVWDAVLPGGIVFAALAEDSAEDVTDDEGAEDRALRVVADVLDGTLEDRSRIVSRAYKLAVFSMRSATFVPGSSRGCCPVPATRSRTVSAAVWTRSAAFSRASSAASTARSRTCDAVWFKSPCRRGEAFGLLARLLAVLPEFFGRLFLVRAGRTWQYPACLPFHHPPNIYRRFRLKLRGADLHWTNRCLR